MSKFKCMRQASRWLFFPPNPYRCCTIRCYLLGPPTSLYLSTSASVIEVIPILRIIGFGWKLHITQLGYLQQLILKLSNTDAAW